MTINNVLTFALLNSAKKIFCAHDCTGAKKCQNLYNFQRGMWCMWKEYGGLTQTLTPNVHLISTPHTNMGIGDVDIEETAVYSEVIVSFAIVVTTDKLNVNIAYHMSQCSWGSVLLDPSIGTGSH